MDRESDADVEHAEERGSADSGAGAVGAGPSGAAKRGLHGFEIFWAAFGLVYGVRLVLALTDRDWREAVVNGIFAVGWLLIAWFTRRRRRGTRRVGEGG